MPLPSPPCKNATNRTAATNEKATIRSPFSLPASWIRQRLSVDGSHSLAVQHIGQEAAQFLLDHGVALTRAGLQTATVEHGNLATAVANEADGLPGPGDPRNAFPAHAENAGNQFLRHDEL